jgi:hypothetical protein
MSQFWEQIEEAWHASYQTELSPIVSVVADTHEFVAEVAQHPDITDLNLTPGLHVERLLLRRLGEELRGVDVLAQGGHGYQAISAAANLFEQSHMLTHFGSDDALAQKYLEWDKPNNPIISVKKVVTSSGKLRGWGEARIKEEYEGMYGMLCGFKHNNPMFFKLLRLGDRCDLYLGQMALANATWFTLSTVGIIAAKRLSDGCVSDFMQRCSMLMDRTRVLYPDLQEDGSAEPE